LSQIETSVTFCGRVGLRAKVLGRLGRKPSPHPRACALSCPSSAIYGPGSLGHLTRPFALPRPDALEAVMNLLSNGLLMRKTEDRRRTELTETFAFLCGFSAEFITRSKPSPALTPAVLMLCTLPQTTEGKLQAPDLAGGPGPIGAGLWASVDA
jgi:hypothetical protein